MTVDETQNILDFAYPKIINHYGKGKLPFPSISLHSDIYTRLSGEPGMEGEELSSKALEEAKDENKAGRTNRDFVNMMRHHINLQTFRASKLAPRVYGNKDQLEISGIHGGEIKVSFEK